MENNRSGFRKSISIDGQMKLCSACRNWKSIDSFSRDKSHWTGYAHSCRECKSKVQRAITPARRRATRLKCVYGLTTDEYDLLLLEQQGVCAICKSDNPGHFGVFVVDHDHETGRIRGLLCNNCNMGIGKFKENANLLQDAASYLRGGQNGKIS